MGCHKSKPKRDVAEPEKAEATIATPMETKKAESRQKIDDDDKMHEEQKVEVQVVNMLDSQKSKTSEILRRKTDEEKVPLPAMEVTTQNRKDMAKKVLEQREAERIKKSQEEKVEKFASLKVLLKQYITKLFTNVGDNTKAESSQCFPFVKQIRIVRKELNELHIDFLPGEEQENYDAFIAGANDIIQRLDDTYTLLKQKKKDYITARREILNLCREADTDLDSIKFADESEVPDEPGINVQSQDKEVLEVSAKKSKKIEKPKPSTKKKASAKENAFQDSEEPAPKKLEPFEEYRKPLEPLPIFEEENRVITEAERLADKDLAFQMEKEKNDAIFEFENAVIKLKRVKEDNATMKAAKSNLAAEIAQMRKEMLEMKREQNNIAFETDTLMVENNTFRMIKDKLVQENQRVKDSYLALKQELLDLQSRADVNIEQYHAEDNKPRLEQLEQQIRQRKLDAEELKDKYNNLKVRYQESNDELVKERANLYRKAVELDLEAIQNGSKALPISENPPMIHHFSQNQAPKSIIADSKIAASLSLIEKAREARIEDPSNIHLDVQPTNIKTVSYFNTDLGKNMQMRYSATSKMSNDKFDYGVDTGRSGYPYQSPYGRTSTNYQPTVF